MTTKRGEAGKTRLTYNGSVSLSHPAEMPKMMNAWQYASILNDHAANGGQPLPYTNEQLEFYRIGAPGYESVDWYSTMMKDYTVNQYHNVSASGGNDKLRFFASLGYNSEPGILRLNSIRTKKRILLQTYLILNDDSRNTQTLQSAHCENEMLQFSTRVTIIDDWFGGNLQRIIQIMQAGGQVNSLNIRLAFRGRVCQ